MSRFDMPTNENPSGERDTISGWKNETVKWQPAVISFLNNYGRLLQESRSRYDGFNELHFSGTNGQVIRKIWEGAVTPIEVNVYYEKGIPMQIHAIFDSENSGHSIDVYFQGKALEDLRALNMSL